MNTPESPKLSFWMAGPGNTALARAARQWFTQLGHAASWVIEQTDPLTCPELLLDLIAWQRGVNRYPGEPDRLYRLRVKFAYINGVDSGSINGWRRIFTRLELGQIGMEERVPGQDWDIIGLLVDDSALPDKQSVLELIIDVYGRTCRRYRFVSRIPCAVTVHSSIFDDNHNTVCAGFGQAVIAAVRGKPGVYDNDHNTVEALWV